MCLNYSSLSITKINLGAEMNLVGFGYSHITAVQFASMMLKNDDISISTTLLNAPSLPKIFTNNDYDCIQFTENFGEYIYDSTTNADVIFLCVAGNAHQIFSLVNHPTPFDFVLEDEPDLPLQPYYETVPYSLVAESLKAQGGYPESIRMLRAFNKFFINKKIVQCALPPVIPSEMHIREYAGQFKEMIEKYGITPEIIRYKHWRLHSKLIGIECNNLGIQYLPVPSSMIDEQGFFRKKSLEFRLHSCESILWVGVDSTIS